MSQGVVSIFTFGIVGWHVGKIAADFYPQLLKNRFLQPVCLLRIVTQLVEMMACFLPCSGVTDKWHLSRSFYAGPVKWRENNGANMTSRSRKKFPVRVSETKRYFYRNFKKGVKSIALLRYPGRNSVGRYAIFFECMLFFCHWNRMFFFCQSIALCHHDWASFGLWRFRKNETSSSCSWIWWF